MIKTIIDFIFSLFGLEKDEKEKDNDRDNNKDNNQNNEEDNDENNNKDNNQDDDIPVYSLEDFKGVKISKSKTRYKIEIENKLKENPENPDNLEIWIITNG